MCSVLFTLKPITAKHTELLTRVIASTQTLFPAVSLLPLLSGLLNWQAELTQVNLMLWYGLAVWAGQKITAWTSTVGV